MAKKCTYCNHMMDDHEQFCSACGKAYIDADDSQVTVSANRSAPGNSFASGYPQPHNSTANKSVSQQPVQAQSYSAPVTQQKAPAPYTPQPANKATFKQRLPYILAGFAAAAVIFVVLLIIVNPFGHKKTVDTHDTKKSQGATVATSVQETLSPAAQLEGVYKWLSGEDGETGKLTVTYGGTGKFSVTGKGTLELSFNTEDNSVSYIDQNTNKRVTGTYTLSGDRLKITVGGYTDEFEREE